MPVISDASAVLYRPIHYETEKDFEAVVVSLADAIFDTSSIYVDVKKRVRGDHFVTIPDGYVVDMTDTTFPRLFVVENEIVRHDPFRHIGIQMLKFVTSFEDAQIEVRNFLMKRISAVPDSMRRLQAGCDGSEFRNIDAYLDEAVYGKFRGLIVIDEARPELHRVIEKINADISVLELRSFCSDEGKVLHIFDTLYDEIDEPLPEEESGGPGSPERRAAKRARRAVSDTIVVPAREEGFKRVFLGEDCWYSIRIGAAMKERLKYIAAYQSAPVSAVTHIAEIAEIRPYKDTGKYVVMFKGAAQEMGPIPVRESKNAPQGPVYVKRVHLESATCLEDALRTD